MAIPREFEGVKVGKTWLTVRSNMFRRGGQAGLVDHFNDTGAGLDFFTCGTCGSANCSCYASMEFWEWGELEPLNEE